MSAGALVGVVAGRVGFQGLGEGMRGAAWRMAAQKCVGASHQGSGKVFSSRMASLLPETWA
jgi:hypothetical protein